MRGGGSIRGQLDPPTFRSPAPGRRRRMDSMHSPELLHHRVRRVDDAASFASERSGSRAGAMSACGGGRGAELTSRRQPPEGGLHDVQLLVVRREHRPLGLVVRHAGRDERKERETGESGQGRSWSSGGRSKSRGRRGDVGRPGPRRGDAAKVARVTQARHSPAPWTLCPCAEPERCLARSRNRAGLRL